MGNFLFGFYLQNEDTRVSPIFDKLVSGTTNVGWKTELFGNSNVESKKTGKFSTGGASNFVPMKRARNFLLMK